MSVPPSELTKLQHSFMRGLVEQSSEAVADIVPGHLTQAVRWDIYRNAYISRLLEVLQQDFEMTWFYLGDQLFAEQTELYLGTIPPHSWTLRTLGDDFSEHLARALSDYPQVAELSHFEWALRSVFDCPDSEQLTLADVQSLEPEKWPGLCFELATGVKLIELEYNTIEVWHALKQEQQPPASCKLDEAQICLIWRDPTRCSRFRTLKNDEAELLSRLAAGEDFSTLCERVQQWYEPERAAYLAGQLLQQWLNDGLISSYRL